MITVTAGKKTATCAVEVMRDRMVNRIYFPPQGTVGSTERKSSLEDESCRLDLRSTQGRSRG